MISAHIAKLTRRSCERESFVMPCAVGSSQRPRIIINMVVCCIKSVHLSAETISTSEFSCKSTEIIIGLVRRGLFVCLCSIELMDQTFFRNRSLFITWGGGEEWWFGGIWLGHNDIYKIPIHLQEASKSFPRNAVRRTVIFDF